MARALLNSDEKGAYFFRFNVDGLLRGDYASRMQGYSIGIQNGFYCPNDIRQLEDMNLIPENEGGFKFIVNGNMVELKDVGAAYGIKTEEQDVLSNTDGTENRQMDGPERRHSRNQQAYKNDMPL